MSKWTGVVFIQGLILKETAMEEIAKDSRPSWAATQATWAALENKDVEAFFALASQKVDFETRSPEGRSFFRKTAGSLPRESMERLAAEFEMSETAKSQFLDEAKTVRDGGALARFLESGFAIRAERDLALREALVLQEAAKVVKAKGSAPKL